MTPELHNAVVEAAQYGDNSVATGFLRSQARTLGHEVSREDALEWIEAARKRIRATPAPDARTLFEAGQREQDRMVGAAGSVNAWTPLDEADADQVIADLNKPVDAAPMPFDSWSRASRDEGGGKGMARGWFAILAATTGQGKSIGGLNIARTWTEHGEQVGYLSLEMSERQLRTRVLAMMSGEPVSRLEPGSHFDEAAMRRAMEAARAIRKQAGGRIYTSSDSLYDLSGIMEAMDTLHRDAGCRAFVVDYVQLAGNPNDPESITAIAHEIRRKTRDLNVVTVGLSQFNRFTSSQGTRPSVHGLMGGSALENDADQIAIIDHTEKKDSPAPYRGWDGVLVLAKNRHGPAGVEIPIRFDSRTLRMSEIRPDELPAMAA